MAVVGSVVVSTWRRLCDASKGERLSNSIAVMGLRLLHELGIPPTPLAHGPTGGECTVTRDELWEWLFIEPAPHGCLAFLDDHDGGDGLAPVVTGGACIP